MKNGRKKREYHGHAAHQQAAAEHGVPHHAQHAGAGAVQRGGQRVRLDGERKRTDQREPGLSGAEPDDRSGNRYWCWYQCAGVALSWREKAGVCQQCCK